MKKLILSLFVVSMHVYASDGGLLAWPSTVALSGFDPIVKNNLPLAKQMLGDVVTEQKPWINELLQDRINQLFMNADLFLLKANHESKDVGKALIKDMHVIIADAIVKARNHIQPMGSKLIDETALHLTSISHSFTIDLAQNVAKALLVSTLGIFGALTAYYYLKAYLSIECQQDIKRVDARWHESKLANYKQHPSSKAAHFLLARLKKLQLVHVDNAQQINIQAVQGGVTLFALACILCCYWIR